MPAGVVRAVELAGEEFVLWRGGDQRVRSAPRRGTTISVTVPLERHD